jgi:hypothetical protein
VSRRRQTISDKLQAGEESPAFLSAPGLKRYHFLERLLSCPVFTDEKEVWRRKRH